MGGFSGGFTGFDMHCSYCGRPIVNSLHVWGAGGVYHLACTQPPREAHSAAVQVGCVCPPGSEATCANPLCGRKVVTGG